MKYAIYPVILIPSEIVPTYVEYNQPAQLLQLDYLLHIRYEIIAQVQLHECLQAVQSIQLLYLVVLHRQLRQTLERVEPVDLADAVAT